MCMYVYACVCMYAPSVYVVEFAESDDFGVFLEHGADEALHPVAQNDVTVLLQLIQNQLTLCMYVCMHVCRHVGM